LGWNFLEFGVRPPEGSGPVWGWIVCAVLFLLMGGIPLVPALAGLARWARGSPPPPAGLRSLATPGSIRTAMSALSTLRQASAGSGPAKSGASGPDLVAVLERLDALHRSGAIDDEEYRTAKRSVLGSEEASP
jgi:hypothetical protein